MPTNLDLTDSDLSNLWRLADAGLRTNAAEALDAAGLTAEAAAVRALSAPSPGDAFKIRDRARQIMEVAWSARQARSAAGDTAGALAANRSYHELAAAAALIGYVATVDGSQYMVRLFEEAQRRGPHREERTAPRRRRTVR